MLRKYSLAPNSSIEVHNTPVTVTETTQENVQGPPDESGSFSYMQDYLSGLMGKRVRIEFIIGSSRSVEKEGILESVGVNYVVLLEPIIHTQIVCDLYSIRFVTVYGVPA